MRKHYVKSDGNGGYNISKGIAVLTLFSLMFALVGSIVAVTAFGITNKNNIDSLKSDIIELKTDVKETTIKEVELEKVVVAIEPRLENIERDVSEIKLSLIHI